MIEITNGKVFINGRETVDATLIGYAILDFAETLESDGTSIELKEQDVFIQVKIIK